jgi:hypothetical protein
MAVVATSSAFISTILVLYIREKTSSEKVPCMTFLLVGPSGRVGRLGRRSGWAELNRRKEKTPRMARLGGITKRGNRYLRRLLINGTSANLLRSKATKADPWVIGLRQRRPPLVVAVTLANKGEVISCQGGGHPHMRRRAINRGGALIRVECMGVLPPLRYA